MDTRKSLEQHAQTLGALLRGGISRGVGEKSAEQEDDLQNSLRAQWEIQHRLIRRVLKASGDPVEQLMTLRERTVDFMNKYPERSGWTDTEGHEWNAEQALDGIDRLLEQIETWEMEEEDFGEYEE